MKPASPWSPDDRSPHEGSSLNKDYGSLPFIQYLSSADAIVLIVQKFNTVCAAPV